MQQQTQEQMMRRKWPATWGALVETYYTDAGWCTTTDAGTNECGYLLASLNRYESLWRDRHGHRDVPQGTLDRAAANEVRYQASRGRVFRRTAAGLSACICALPMERPERIYARAAAQVRRES